MVDGSSTDFSDAYDRLVRPEADGSADIVGLLAYALYKGDKRELARSGQLDRQALTNHHKTLTTNLVEQYRDSALRSLETYATEVVEKSIPQIQDATRTDAIESSKSEILRELRSVGSPWWSVLWNVVAWLVSLAITFLIAVASGAVSITIAPR